jgi:glyoxylase-like metal-dependent hydrolase (beta-lactamase superfamily II)
MRKWQIGDVTVTKIVEMESAGGATWIIPDATREACSEIDWLKPEFMNEDGDLRFSVHALVVDTPDHRILVDTCVGNDKNRLPFKQWHQLQTTFLDDFQAAGFALESVDYVLCTHLHVDHVGWNTRLVDGEWVPTFPGARYLVARQEYEFWRDQQEQELSRTVFDDSVLPVFEAGLFDLVDVDHSLCEQVDFVPTLGHTPGHISVRIRSRGEQALITGDFIHHPCQMARLDWGSSADSDPAAANATRRRVFDEYADTPMLIIGTHFAGKTAGHIVRDGDAYRLVV